MTRKTSIGTVFLLEDNEMNGLRDGEGSIARAADGALLFAYTHFTGPSDHSPANIVMRRSTDNGETWSAREVFLQAPREALNVMSVSLLRMEDGRIACSYMVKYTAATHAVPFFRMGDEFGSNWSEAAAVSEDEAYYVLNNDRMIQLETGRLLIPVARHSRSPDNKWDKNAYCGCFISDDSGASWRKSRDWKRYEKRHWLEPCSWTKGEPDIDKIIEERENMLQEPGVVSQGGNRVYGWARTATHIYHSRSDDGGDTWNDYTAIPEFQATLSPSTIKRVPNSDMLLMLFNDRGAIPYGNNERRWRTPLSCAISRDGGRNWRKVRDLESDDSRSYCYASLLMEPEFAIASYYESAPVAGEKDTLGRRRNLASLRVHRFGLAELL